MLLFVTFIVKFSNKAGARISYFRFKTVDIKWKKLIFRVSVWLTLEILFDYVGLDTVADYSEFIFERNLITLSC
jgi:hypothetical protein